ncbi:MAG: transposase [Solirubrobacterales bacterium]
MSRATLKALRWARELDHEIVRAMPQAARVPGSSDRHDRHRLDRGGNRQINRALHVIAITRGRLDPETRAYLQRKEAEGKTRMEAIRCLKRHLARRYHRLLSDRSRHRIEHQAYPDVP